MSVWIFISRCRYSRFFEIFEKARSNLKLPVSNYEKKLRSLKKLKNFGYGSTFKRWNKRSSVKTIRGEIPTHSNFSNIIRSCHFEPLICFLSITVS